MGHSSVTRSLITGLQELDVAFTHNKALSDTSEIIGIVAGMETLRWILPDASSGITRNRENAQILVGPNIAQNPESIKNWLLQPAVTTVVPSNWVKEAYENDIPRLRNRVKCWAAGIDPQRWQPSTAKQIANDVLVYVKGEMFSRSEIMQVIDLVRKVGFGSQVISYGKYSQREYRDALDRSIAVIWMGGFESQCIAQFEAWAMDVPTLVGVKGPSDRERFKLAQQQQAWPNPLSEGMESPYLTHETGLFWSSLADLRRQLYEFSDRRFTPREWILMNGTDRASALTYLSLFD